MVKGLIRATLGGALLAAPFLSSGPIEAKPVPAQDMLAHEVISAAEAARDAAIKAGGEGLRPAWILVADVDRNGAVNVGAVKRALVAEHGTPCFFDTDGRTPRTVYWMFPDRTSVGAVMRGADRVSGLAIVEVSPAVACH